MILNHGSFLIQAAKINLEFIVISLRPFSGIENLRCFNETVIQIRSLPMNTHKIHTHSQLYFITPASVLLLISPLWFSAIALGLVAVVWLTMTLHRHWEIVCFGFQVISEFMAFCLLVLVFVGLSLGLSALVDWPPH